MGILDNLMDKFADSIAGRVTSIIGKDALTTREYRRGNQPKQLKVNKEKGQYDDNMVINFVGLVVNRSVSQMVGQGVELRFDGEDGKTTTAQGDWIRACLNANHEEILFHRAALAATEAGTGYFFIMGENTVYDNDGKGYPRILIWDPALVTMHTLRNDFDLVYQYIHEYYIKDEKGNQTGYRKVVERDMESEAEQWYIRDYEMLPNTSKWVMVNEQVYEYPFCPVIHWQNLPTIDSQYGDPDISVDIRELQNRINGNASNVAKVTRLTAHPFKWGKGTKPGENMDSGPDKMPWLGPDGEIHVEPPNDNTTGLQLLNWMRASFFDTTRTVDIASLADKLGSLTNFALKVIYQDNKSKIETKRELFGDAIEELVYRLQLIGGLQPVHAEVEWPDFLPVDDMAVAQADTNLVAAGIISKQTAAEHQGRDWESETKRMAGEKATENAQTNNIGAMLLNNFNRGV